MKRQTLKKGPGHYPTPRTPGRRPAGSGSRSSHDLRRPFWSLNELEAGDRIVLATDTDLRVPRHGLGDHLAVGRFGPAVDHRPTLVLTTCNPRFSAAERLMVFADRVD